MTSGYIYCLSNPCFEGWYKIGKTTRTPGERAKELYSTGVPKPFTIVYAKYTMNIDEDEINIHELIKKDCLEYSKEFFKIDIEIIKKIFDELEGNYYIIDEEYTDFAIAINNKTEDKKNTELQNKIKLLEKEKKDFVELIEKHERILKEFNSIIGRKCSICNERGHDKRKCSYSS